MSAKPSSPPAGTSASVVCNTQRFRAANEIIDVAADPTVILHSLLDACAEIKEQPNSSPEDLCNDPAVRMMVYHLARVTGARPLYEVYGATRDELKKAAAEEEARAAAGAEEPLVLRFHETNPIRRRGRACRSMYARRDCD
jgi:hypothetical protein